jgi:hypothetical protein
VGLARGNSQSLPRRAADEEHVALSAFASFCRVVEGGGYLRMLSPNEVKPFRLLEYRRADA